MLLLLNLNQGPEWSSKDQSKEPWMSFSVCCIDLSLRWRNFLDHDSGHGVQSSKSICSFPSHAPTDIDSHSDGSLADSFAVSSNLSNFVNVRVCSSVIWGDKHLAINGERFATFHTIERWKTIANGSRDIQRFWCRHCTPLLRRCYRHVYEKRSPKKRNKDVEIHQNQKERKSLSIKSFRLSLDAIRVINLNNPFQLPFTFINPLSLPASTFFHAHCFQFLCRPWLPCSPLAPLGPIFPRAPACPLRPLSPRGPTGPLSPGGPTGPWSPLAPSLPLSPGTPGSPLVEMLMTVGHWGFA